jgi:hypothetical protein
VIDLDNSNCLDDHDHHHSQQDDESQLITRWEIMEQFPLLNTERTSVIHRILYVPWWHEHATQHGDIHYHQFTLYRRSN